MKQLKAGAADRRSALRREVNWQVVVTRSTGDVLICRVIDISEEGLRLRSAYAFPPGSLLRLKLAIPGLGERLLRCRVCYQVLESDAILTGVRFENNDSDALAFIQKGCTQ